MLTQPNEIERWQAGAGAEADADDIGIVARLLRACIESISYLIQRTVCSQLGLRRCLSILKLWAHGHGAWNGKLDNVLERSRNLQHTALSILNPLCKVLFNGIDRFAVAGPKDDLSISLRTSTAEIYSQTKWLLVGLEESVSDSDSDSDSDKSGDEQEQSGLERLVKDVKTHVDCLVDLGNALECPAIDPEHEDEPSVLKFEQRAAHDYHADLILAKFPKAHVELVVCLGRISWDRYQRMQEQREVNANAITSLHIDNEGIVASAQKSRLADSEFKDSGLGTSLPSAPPSRYAETVISFMTSIAGGKRVQIPPLPTEARNGAQFECNACGKNIRATNNREWRKHLYLDLQPYTCFYTNCAFSSKPFADRQLWSNHLELDHKFGPDWKSVTCPLCLDSTEAGKAKMLIHFARHMEDIALAALPREVESDEESEGGTDLASENVSEVLLSDDNLTRSETEEIKKFFGESDVMQELQLSNTTQDDITSISATTSLSKFVQAQQDFWSRDLPGSEEQRHDLWMKVAPAVPINALSTTVAEMNPTDLAISRCKVFRLMGNDWVDLGTGVLRIAPEDQTHWALVVWSENTASRKLVSTPLNMEVIFQKQQSTLIVWTAQDGTHMALSFQEPAMCTLAWRILLQLRENLERYYKQFKAVAKESMVPDSYWSMSELRSFREYVGRYGTDWTTIADNMPTKTSTMIKNQYLNNLEQGDIELVKLAQEAEARKALPRDLVASDVSLQTLAQPISEIEHPRDQVTEWLEELYEETEIVEPEAGSVSKEAREDDRIANSPREGRLSRASKHLRAWLEANQDHPYPDADTKRILAEECDVTVRQCSVALSYLRARMAQPNDPTHDGGSQTSPKFATIAQGVVQSHDEHKLSSVIESTSDPSETMASEPIPEDMESSVIKCICGFSDDDGNTVLCEVCDSWQHIICYHGRSEYVPDVHECIDCNPRPMDRDGAKQVQSRRRELLHVKKNKQHKQNATRKDKQRNGPLQSTADQVVNDSSTSQKPRIAAVSPEILASTKDLTTTASLPGVQYTRTGRVGKAKKGLKIHNCECGRSYTRAEHLRRHQKNHANDDVLLCHICDKTFYRSDLLERHIERHSEEDPSSQHRLLNLPVPLAAQLMSPTQIANVNSTKRMDLPVSQEEDSSEPRYCYCNKQAHGHMIACDYDRCPRQWFHLACIKPEKRPGLNEKWVCSVACKFSLAAPIEPSQKPGRESVRKDPLKNIRRMLERSIREPEQEPPIQSPYNLASSYGRNITDMQANNSEKDIASEANINTNFNNSNFAMKSFDDNGSTIDQPGKRLFSKQGAGLSQTQLRPALKNYQLEGNDQSELARSLRQPQDMNDAIISQLPLPEEVKPFRCPVIGCKKAYKNQTGLKYHKQHGHQNQQLKENEDGFFSVIDPLKSIPYLGSRASSPSSSIEIISPQPQSKGSTGPTVGQERTSKSAEDDVKTVASGGSSSVDNPYLRPQCQEQLTIDSSIPTTVRSSRTRRHTKLPPHAMSHLRNWFNAHRDNPYPSADTKRMLAQECGLNEKQVTTWFTNSRARQLGPQFDYRSESSDYEGKETEKASQITSNDTVSLKHKSGVNETKSHGHFGSAYEADMREGSLKEMGTRLSAANYDKDVLRSLDQKFSSAVEETPKMTSVVAGLVGSGVWVCVECDGTNSEISPQCFNCGTDQT